MVIFHSFVSLPEGKRCLVVADHLISWKKLVLHRSQSIQTSQNCISSWNQLKFQVSKAPELGRSSLTSLTSPPDLFPIRINPTSSLLGRSSQLEFPAISLVVAATACVETVEVVDGAKVAASVEPLLVVVVSVAAMDTAGVDVVVVSVASTSPSVVCTVEDSEGAAVVATVAGAAVVTIVAVVALVAVVAAVDKRVVESVVDSSVAWVVTNWTVVCAAVLILVDAAVVTTVLVEVLVTSVIEVVALV